jgi:hypothetical protein
VPLSPSCIDRTVSAITDLEFQEVDGRGEAADDQSLLGDEIGGDAG